jgi:predicted ATPase
MTSDCRLIVVTGAPGAGKTALLEVLRRSFCEHVAVLPDAADIVFRGGFARHSSQSGRRAAQRAIYRVQVEQERLIKEEHAVAAALCDRGTLDGIAYWPGDVSDFWREVDTTAARELARYAAIIHLRTPPPSDHTPRNQLRPEIGREAAVIDQRIAHVWRDHARVFTVDPAPLFGDKVARALAIVRGEVPHCEFCPRR